jgi:hypothetical protein
VAVPVGSRQASNAGRSTTGARASQSGGDSIWGSGEEKDSPNDGYPWRCFERIGHAGEGVIGWSRWPVKQSGRSASSAHCSWW